MLGVVNDTGLSRTVTHLKAPTVPQHYRAACMKNKSLETADHSTPLALTPHMGTAPLFGQSQPLWICSPGGQGLAALVTYTMSGGSECTGWSQINIEPEEKDCGHCSS